MKKNSQNISNNLSLQMLADEGKKQKKPLGFFSGLLIGFLTVASLASLFTVALWFDLFSLKQDVSMFLQLEQAQFEVLEERRLAVMSEEAELLALESELADEKEALNQRLETLNRREEALQTFEAELDDRAGRIATQETELDELVALYESMTPDQAAQVLLLGEDKVLTARILARIDQKRLTMILGQVSPQEASELITLLSGAAVNGQPADESDS